MATGLVLTVAQTLFAALDSDVLKETCSMFGYESELQELKGTVSTIKAVLLDAEVKQQELSHEAKDWIDKLKDALYDADDLLDTVTQQERQMANGKNKIFQKVQRFFSRSNQLIFAFNTSLDIKMIKKKLDDIAGDHSKFGLSVDHPSIWKGREETCSYVYEERIIGRDGDKEELVGMILKSNLEDDVSFVIIVGIGGLGKTTLAQLVYNDDRIKREFQLRLWVCVSQEFGVKEVLGKMLMSLNADENGEHLGLDELQRKVRQHIETQRYLLVLDDVWNENRDAWVKLKDFLVRGGRGSKIVVTSRSKKVATTIGNYPMYELQGLSENDTWRLFQGMAFDSEEEKVDADLVKIGKDIAKNVPMFPSL